MAELADRRFVGHRLVAEIDLREAAHQRRVIQRFLHRRVGEAEPLLKKVNAQHALHANGTASIARLGIVRFQQRTQLAPRNHLFHLFQKQRPLRLLRVPLESHLLRQTSLLHLAPTSAIFDAE